MGFGAFLATGAFGVLLLFLLAGGGVAAGLASLFSFGSAAFWIGIAAFTVFFIARH